MRFLLLLYIFLYFNYIQSNIIIQSKLNNNKNIHIKSTNSLSKQSEFDIISAATSSIENKSGSSTISSSIFNLAKCILGAGILSLPSGVAKFSDNVSGLIPSSLLLALLGIMSAYSFQSIGRVCAENQVSSISEAWGVTVHKQSKILILGLILFKTCLACLCYSIIIGDSFSSIFASMGIHPSIASRTNVIVGLTATCILPLCSLKNLDALKYTSILGLAGTLYTSLFMLLRYLDGSYASGGLYYNSISSVLRPSFNSHIPKSKDAIFVLLSMIATAYVAHYNAPRFLLELKEPTLKNYNIVVIAGFALSFIMYMLVMWVGFLTFGSASTGFILNNYANTDVLATFARISIGTGILCGYPLTFTALRDGVLDLLNIKDTVQRNKLLYPITIGILTVITAVALVVTNVGAVVGFSGALIGATLIFVIPAIMNICNIIKQHQKKNPTTTTRITTLTMPTNKGSQLSFKQYTDINMNLFMAISGLIIAIIGVKVNIAH